MRDEARRGEARRTRFGLNIAPRFRRVNDFVFATRREFGKFQVDATERIDLVDQNAKRKSLENEPTLPAHVLFYSYKLGQISNVHYRILLI